jgi:enoyl-CoA hydratase/carnithine racemase
MYHVYTASPDDFQSVRYWVDGKVAHIQLNRPASFNAIDQFMPFELEKSVELANLDDNVRVCEQC